MGRPHRRRRQARVHGPGAGPSGPVRLHRPLPGAGAGGVPAGRPGAGVGAPVAGWGVQNRLTLSPVISVSCAGATNWRVDGPRRTDGALSSHHPTPRDRAGGICVGGIQRPAPRRAYLACTNRNNVVGAPKKRSPFLRGRRARRGRRGRCRGGGTGQPHTDHPHTGQPHQGQAHAAPAELGGVTGRDSRPGRDTGGPAPRGHVHAHAVAATFHLSR